MRRSILFLSLVAATIAVVACSSATAPSASKKPGAKSADLIPVDTSVCRSGYQLPSGRCA